MAWLPAWARAILGARSIPQLITRLFDSYVPQLIFQALYYLVPINLGYRLLRNFRSRSQWSPKNKVALIHDATSRAGKSLAYELAAQGARLMLVASHEDELRSIARSCLSKGAVEAEVCAVDTSTEAGCHRAVETTEAKFANLDILVIAVSMNPACPFKQAQSIESLRETWEADFTRNIWLTLIALPHLRRSHGRILVNAPLTVLAPSPKYSVYSASMAALVQYFETLRVEEARHRINVTVAYTGPIQSEERQGKRSEAWERLSAGSEPRMEVPTFFPKLRGEACAPSMIKSLAWGRRCTVVPYWGAIIFMYHLLVGEALNFFMRFGSFSMKGSP